MKKRGPKARGHLSRSHVPPLPFERAHNEGDMRRPKKETKTGNGNYVMFDDAGAETR